MYQMEAGQQNVRRKRKSISDREGKDGTGSDGALGQMLQRSAKKCCCTASAWFCFLGQIERAPGIIKRKTMCPCQLCI